MVKVNNIYSSAACNRTPESADWGINGLILYAASNAVVIFDPHYNNSSKVINTFVKHSARVNTVKWIQNKGNNETEFISGSDDSTCLLWNISDISNPKIYTLKGHNNGVTVCSSIYRNDVLTIVTASTDSTIKFWAKNIHLNEWNCSQTISLGNGFCFAISLCILPNTSKILAAFGNDDHKIHLYSEQLKTNEQNNTEPSVIYEPIELLHGHEDWIRSLDFIEIDNNEILLASSSQDTFIRLWKISQRRASTTDKIQTFAQLTIEDNMQIEEKIITIKSNDNNSYHFVCSLESVLLGHDGWVYCVHWNKSENGVLQLLSSSIDKTLIIWQLNSDDVWMEKIRVGEVGGNSLGFYGGKFSANGKSIMGHGYQGSFHIWHSVMDNDNDDIEACVWNPGTIVSGHYADVRDIGWEPDGQFLFSLSADQTTRIHAPWIQESGITWHEIARPQVHGYDMQCLCVLSQYRFASGAEEKIVRTFQAPGNFVENLQRLSKTSPNDEAILILKSTPQGASVPSLGLSNKGVYCTEALPTIDTKHIKDEYPENYFVPIQLNAPPSEETLMQNTLWPEIHKLYGHGYEIFALCATMDGKILASSCKAANAEHAQIILWNTTTWKQIQKLASHQLTVTQMKFSPNNKYLLSVSRDRRWSIFENRFGENKDKPSSINYELIATTDKKNGLHNRIIWTCDWTYDSKYFATGSRDGKVIVWYYDDNSATMDKNETASKQSSMGNFKSMPSVLELKGQSITALTFSHKLFNDTDQAGYLISIGLECGEIHLYKFNGNWHKLYVIEKSFAHHLTVKKLSFRPNFDKINLASCGEDHFVRIFEIEL